ncbi:MAG: hypothetical protein ACYS14_04140 [Planctomycetota bacterium]
MRDERNENEQLENLLSKAYVSEASTELKERITAQARKAWNQTPVEVSWPIPLRRLVSAAAAAVIMVSVTNYSSDRALQRWRSGESFATRRWPAELDALTEMTYGPFARQLAILSRKPSRIGASVLLEHVETVRRAIDELQQNGTPDSAVPLGGSSRMIPTGRSANPHSWT